jgi:alanine or glycine:cation symporter, AGCS family
MFVSLFMGLFGSASAQEALPPEKDLFAEVDAAFGEYFVGPLASVLFWDVMFWDNTLPLGEGVGILVDGQYVVSYDTVYQLQEQFTAPKESLTIRLTDPITNKNDFFEWTISQTSERTLSASIPYTTVPTLEVELIPLEEWKGVVPEASPVENGKERFVTEALTEKGIPILVDRKIAGKEEVEPLPLYEVLAVTMPVPLDKFPIETGTTVWVESKQDVQGNQKDQGVEWVEATYLELKSSTTTRFEKVKGEGYQRTDTDSKQAVLRAEAKTTQSESLKNPDNVSLPAVVIWLVLGAIYFTLRMGFISIRGFGHAIKVVRGDFDDEEQEGEVSHFQALSSALSATVGLGNIAGVAIAVSVGGPGAIFWMIVAGFLGMSSKFTECTLGQMYRTKDSNGNTLGGPMRYLDVGLAELKLRGLGKVLAIVFAVMCVGGSFGGGNMFQANQSYVAVADLVPFLGENEYGSLIYGVVLAGLTGVVILGGIKSIGKVAEIIVPLMCGLYLLAGGFILLTNASAVPDAIGVIFDQAFATESAFGGMIGALIQGFRRAAFSNEAGVGSASIAHSAAATNEPVSEGIVALLEPFIDTIIVCSMTGLVVVITGAYLDTSLDGVAMTAAAFGSVIPWFPVLLSIAVFFFAFSTMISWSYYGERCAIYLFGENASQPYKLIFLFFIVMGSTIKLGNVLDFSDLMILGMAFPNILGLFLLSGKVRTALDDYWTRVVKAD